jgi:hypothetical protein
MVQTTKRRLIQSLSFAAAACVLASTSFLAHAEVPAALQPKIDKYKKHLVEWAATPALVAAVREANAKGSGGMTNAKWNDLDEKDPVVLATMSGPVATMVIKWEQDKNINKLFVRDQKGNVVVGTAKTLLFNAASRPSVANALKGTVWNENAVKPDPTTQVKGVQVSAPVLDGGAVIGVLHTSVTAE